MMWLWVLVFLKEPHNGMYIGLNNYTHYQMKTFK